MSQEEFGKYWDNGLKVLSTFALIAVALLGTKFVTKEEFNTAYARIEKIEAVLIRMEQNAETDKRHDQKLEDHEQRLRAIERKPL
jgi:hypothetical protein